MAQKDAVGRDARDIDWSRLTTDEQSVLRWLVRGVRERDEAVLPKDARRREFEWTFIGPSLVGAGLLWFASAGFEDTESALEGWSRGAGVVALAVALLLFSASIASSRRPSKKAFDAVIPRYLTTIGYAKRPARRGGGVSDDGSQYWMTGSYDPARYYGYSKQERDYMRSTGIDADTYDSNVRDRD